MAKAYRLGALTSVLALALAVGGYAAAQGVPQRTAPGGVLRPSTAVQPPISQPVVQPVPSSDGMTLDAALGRLARDPRDIGALIDAGNAALAMGDVDAATGFFRRADQVSPGNPRVKAGLAGAMVRNGDPFGAIPLFDEAEKAGALDSTLAADRGLAYDLVGDNVTAQRFYRQALARMPSDEVVRRLSLSLAIAGDKHNAELILSPLLQQRNLAAWRTRAFVLAILGQTEEAVGIANTILPSELASSVAPYLRYMPRLTHAQQAAAANFGMFPRASEIGRDDPRVALYAPKQTSVAKADATLTPQGEPLGRKARGRDRNRDRDRASRNQVAAASPAVLPGAGTRLAPPEPPQPAREVTAAVAAPTRTASPAVASATRSSPAPAPPVAQIAMAPTPAPAPPPPASSPLVARSEPSRSAAPSPAPQASAAMPQRTGSGMLAVAPGFSIAPAPGSAAPPPAAQPPVTQPPATQPVASPPVAPPPQPVARPAPVAAPAPPPSPRNLADAFAEFARPTTDATPAAGAVDLRRIKPGRADAKKPAEPVKPPPPSHPSRIWVQIATGRDKAALGYDWRRLTREKADVLRGKASFVSAWGQTNRLLTGPFPSESAANSFIAQLRRADVDGAFVWTSPAGQVVDTLGAAPSEPTTRARRGAEPEPPAKTRRGTERNPRGRKGR